jgi:hypothetical protein
MDYMTDSGIEIKDRFRRDENLDFIKEIFIILSHMEAVGDLQIPDS